MRLNTVAIKGSLTYTIGASNTATLFIDDDHATRYEVRVLKQVSVYASGIDSPAVFELWRFGRSASAATVPFQITTNTSMGTQPTSFYRVYGDVQGNNNAAFAAYATRARLNFTGPFQGVTSGSGGVNLFVPAINQNIYAITYQPAWQFVRLEMFETNAVEGSGSIRARLRLSRPVAGPVVSIGANFSGSAASADHNLGASLIMTLANNATSIETTITATTDAAFEGWETLIITPEFNLAQTSLDPRSPFMAFFADNVADPELLPAADFDRDGLPDRWETAHQLDPFDRTDAQIDTDKDGLTNGDEYQTRTNPQSPDTDGEGEGDFLEVTRSPALDPDFLEIRLVTRDTGKVNNGQNCAVCHTTELRVGSLRHFSAELGTLAEKSYFVRKGSNYPIHLSELLRDLPPTPIVTGNPATTAQYTAAVLPATGQPAAFVLNDPQTKLGTNKPWSQFPADPATAIGGLVVPRIEVLWTNVPGNLDLDANPNALGGLRLFPDRLNPNDGSPRDRVIVEIRTTPPLAGRSMRLKSFDVDDPTPYDFDPMGLVDTNDFLQIETGGDNRGTPKAGQLADTVLTLDAQGKAFTVFTVSRQPGDNFRVAVVLDGPGALDHLNTLQVSVATAETYLPAGQGPVFRFVGGLSPMLTIWRKLHLEFDSMTAPPTAGSQFNGLTGTVVNVKTLFPAPDKSQITVAHNTIGYGNSLFENGKLLIANVGSFRILKSYTHNPFQGRTFTRLEILGVPSQTLIGNFATIIDDDDQYLSDEPLYRSDLALATPPLPADFRSGEIVNAIALKFAPAYILPVNANALGWNTQPTIQFLRSAEARLSGPPFDAGNFQLKGTDSFEFWSHTICFAYQPELPIDGDPNTEAPLAGVTIKKSPVSQHSYTVIYLESIRERQFTGQLPGVFVNSGTVPTLRNSYAQDVYGTTAHEIGHAPGDRYEFQDHAERGLMEKGALSFTLTEFSEATINRFRNARTWTE